MNVETILAIVFAILSIVGIVLSYYFYVRNKISTAITSQVDNAEDLEVEGEKKKAEVVLQLKNIIPVILKPFISDALLESLVQAAFDKIESYAKKQAAKKAKKSEDSSNENS
jgi:hypothetical protein